MKLHLVSTFWPLHTECGRELRAFGRRVGEATTSDRALFVRRKNAKPGEVCSWCVKVDESAQRVTLREARP